MSKIIKGEGSFFDPTLLGVGNRGVVPLEDILASDRAREILRQAREEAGRIREQAKKILAEAIEEKEAERNSGFEEGHQEGLAQLTERLVTLEQEREELLKQQEKEIVEMVLAIAKKVVARELKKGAIADLVRQAISQAVGDRVVVRIHPDDKEKLGEVGSKLTLHLDETITPGGCLVETELGTVDARLETQWKAIQKALGLEEENVAESD